MQTLQSLVFLTELEDFSLCFSNLSPRRSRWPIQNPMRIHSPYIEAIPTESDL